MNWTLPPLTNSFILCVLGLSLVMDILPLDKAPTPPVLMVSGTVPVKRALADNMCQGAEISCENQTSKSYEVSTGRNFEREFIFQIRREIVVDPSGPGWGGNPDLRSHRCRSSQAQEIFRKESLRQLALGTSQKAVTAGKRPCRQLAPCTPAKACTVEQSMWRDML